MSSILILWKINRRIENLAFWSSSVKNEGNTSRPLCLNKCWKIYAQSNSTTIDGQVKDSPVYVKSGPTETQTVKLKWKIDNKHRSSKYLWIASLIFPQLLFDEFNCDKNLYTYVPWQWIVVYYSSLSFVLFQWLRIRKRYLFINNK